MERKYIYCWNENTFLVTGNEYGPIFYSLASSTRGKTNKQLSVSLLRNIAYPYTWTMTDLGTESFVIALALREQFGE